MNQRQWQDIVGALRDAADMNRSVDAAAALQSMASREDVPRLLELLEDDDLVVRAAAAWPLSDLGVVEAIPAIVRAKHRGTDEGDDNDSLNAALADLVSMNAEAASPVVRALTESTDPRLRDTGEWLLEFCGPRA